MVDSAPPAALVAPSMEPSPLGTNPGLQGWSEDRPVLMGPGLLLAPVLLDMPFHIRVKLEPRNWV